MRVERLGERAVIVRDLPCEAYLFASALNKLGRFQEAVASYETVGIYFSSPLEDLESLQPVLESVLLGERKEKHLELPVCYELGEDLANAANALGIEEEELIQAHVGEEYRCYAVGFSPGFAYLGYLDEELALPRLPSPRKRVESGSVGITGRQTAVYPSATPGGWNLIGRCPLQLVDVEDRYFPIEAGDLVRFRRIDEAEFARLNGERL